MSDKPLISVIFGGRNDDYQENWIERFEFTLNYNLFSLNKINDAHRVEIIIVDFCSENKIKDNLSLIATNTIVRIYEVSNSHEDSPDYHVGLSLNTGLQRATGSYCMVMGSDQFMTTSTWRNLISHLDVERFVPERKSMYRLIPRKQLPTSFSFRCLTREVTERHLEGFLTLILNIEI